MITRYSVMDFVPYPILSIPLIWVKPGDKIWYVSTLLNRYLGSFTDCVVVMDNGLFCGVIDGRDLLSALYREPTSDFFQNSTAEDIMTRSEIEISPQTTVLELVDRWEKTRRDYAILKNHNNNLCTISARTVSDSAVPHFDYIKAIEIQRNEIITCSKNNTIGEVLQLMFKGKIRRIFYDGYSSFVSDRTIIKKIVTEFDFLRKIDNLLDVPISKVGSELPILVNHDVLLKESIISMAKREQSCLVFPDNRVATYHDIVMSLKKFFKQN